MTRFPFTSFPNGWFKVAYSDELSLKKVMPLHYFGKDLVLFRTEDGISHVFDAHCPHLGAHLGHGGQVNRTTIQCPFHGWCFNSLGSCVEIPYVSKIPPKAQIRSWPVREVNRVIMMPKENLRLGKCQNFLDGIRKNILISNAIVGKFAHTFKNLLKMVQMQHTCLFYTS